MILWLRCDVTIRFAGTLSKQRVTDSYFCHFANKSETSFLFFLFLFFLHLKSPKSLSISFKAVQSGSKLRYETQVDQVFSVETIKRAPRIPSNAAVVSSRNTWKRQVQSYESIFQRGGKGMEKEASLINLKFGFVGSLKKKKMALI